MLRNPFRRLLGLLHRWFGLFTATFLFIAGATGAVISWDHELDAWLNPAFYVASTGAPRSSLEIADRVERDDPKVQVSYLPLSTVPGEALQVWVEARVDAATRAPHDVGYNEISIDPASGRELARRMWGDASLSRENLLPFLYKLHYSLQIPLTSAGTDIGSWFMGIVAIVWVFDAFVALWLSFPNWRSWRKSFAFRARNLNFDLHRSGGVWLWLLVLTLAITAVSMNLRTQVVTPIVSTFSTLTPNPFDVRTPLEPSAQTDPSISRAQALDLANAEAKRRGWTAPAGAVLYSPEYGVYGVGYFEAGDDHGDGSLGHPWLYFDARDGAPAGADIPGTGSAGDIFLQAQFPIHSGRILGLAGRILISLLGVAIAALSVTGVVIWLRKRRAQLRAATRTRGLGLAH
ncbi:MAG: PepSY-associated TM helix domain-containing protein [Rhodanobacteraceae bacterium]